MIPTYEEAVSVYYKNMVPQKELPIVIGLVGKSGAGKDKFYWQVLSQFSYVRLAFADPVRVFASIMLLKAYDNVSNDTKELLRIFPFIYQEVFSPEKSGLSRTLQQYLGTNIAREYDKDYWINTMRPIVEKYLENNIRIVFTDVRFENEANFVKSIGGKLIRITGKGRYSEQSLEAKHESETELETINCDFTDQEFLSFVERLYYKK